MLSIANQLKLKDMDKRITELEKQVKALLTKPKPGRPKKDDSEPLRQAAGQ